MYRIASRVIPFITGHKNITNHDQLRDIDHIVENGEGNADQDHSSVLFFIFDHFLISKQEFHLELVDPGLVEDGDHLHNVGGVGCTNGQVEPGDSLVSCKELGGDSHKLRTQ